MLRLLLLPDCGLTLPNPVRLLLQKLQQAVAAGAVRRRQPHSPAVSDTQAQGFHGLAGKLDRLALPFKHCGTGHAKTAQQKTGDPAQPSWPGGSAGRHHPIIRL